MDWCTMGVILLLSVSLSGATAMAQVVQLPTFSSVGYSGTVWVPDQGSASLAGSGFDWGSWSSRNGMLPNFSTNRLVEAGGVVVNVEVVDPRALDRELRIDVALAQRRREQAVAETSSRPVSLQPPDDPVEKGKWLVRRARAALADRLPQVARIYYQQALPLLTPELQRLAQQELNRLPDPRPGVRRTRGQARF